MAARKTKLINKTESKSAKQPASKKTRTKESEPAVLTEAKNEGVRRWIGKVNKNRSLKGKAEILFASQVNTPYNLRRPTGILGLDIALGGGLPAGGSVEFHGPESAGKTFLVYHTCGTVQRIYGDETTIAIFSTELRPDKGFARLAGFCVAYSKDEIEEMEAIRLENRLPAFTDEEREDLEMQIGDIIIITAATADVGFDVVISGLEEGIFQIIVIDSLGALLTEEVKEGDVGDAHYAGPSRIITQFQNKVYPLFTMNRPDGKMLETTLIGVNQMRANVGGGRFEDKDKPGMGAWAWKHGQLVNLRLEKGPKIYEGEKGKSAAIGHIVRWTTIKGKAGTHDGKKGEYEYYHFPKKTPVFWKDVQEFWMGGPAIFEEMVEAAKTLGVIDSAGAWLSWTSSDGEMSNRSQGSDGMASYFAQNKEAEEHLRRQCLKAAGLLVRYK